MKSAGSVLIVLSLVVIAGVSLHAQGEYEKMNARLGATASAPFNPTAKYVHAGWGLLGGAGYNFSQHHSVFAEFIWSRLHATGGALQPLSRDIDGRSDLYVLTGNYRYELRGKEFGTY